MIPASTCLSRHTHKLRARTIPTNATPLILDSGGFLFALKGIDFPFSRNDYLTWSRQHDALWTATLDYPCERQITTSTRTRQARTLLNTLHLLDLDPTRFIAVLQGWTLSEYLQHAEDHTRLNALTPHIGIGTLCARKNSKEVATIANTLARSLPTHTFHLFGVKRDVFAYQTLEPNITTADTAAWNRRFGPNRHLLHSNELALGISQRRADLTIQLPAYKQSAAHWGVE